MYSAVTTRPPSYSQLDPGFRLAFSAVSGSHCLVAMMSVADGGDINAAAVAVLDGELGRRAAGGEVRVVGR